MQSGHGLISGQLPGKPQEIPLQILGEGLRLQIAGVSPKELICPLPGQDARLAMLPCPLADKI